MTTKHRPVNGPVIATCVAITGPSLRLWSQMELPPILQIPGLRLIEMGNDMNGTYLKFAVNRRKVREVTMYMLANQPVAWRYIYSMWDATTRTVITYDGPFGDPTKDQPTDLRGI